MFPSSYPARFTTGGDGRVMVQFIDLPRVATDGRDYAEAFAEAMDERGIGNSELARSLGVDERVIRRMLDPGHATKAVKIQAALAALGKQMTLEVRDAA